MEAPENKHTFRASELPVIVIGAGLGGLSAAIHLASAGKRVIVLERNAMIGGKMGEIRQAGYRWDTGPSVITMRHVLEDLFTTAGRSLEDYVQLQPIEPLTRYFYPDGTVINISRDLPATLEQIRQIEPQDVDGYLRFLAYTARLHRIVGPVFIYNQPPNLGRLLEVPWREALAVDGLRSMQQAIRGFVKAPHLQQLLGRYATYVGASPYQAPATLNVIAHVELNQGVWYPRGGVYRLAEAYASLAEEMGVELRTNCSVEHIEVVNERARGVHLAEGRFLPAAAVVANLDVANVYEHLLPGTAAVKRKSTRLNEQPTSSSGFALLLGVRGTHAELAHHNIFFSNNYRAEFEQIFSKGVPPEDPTIYAALSCHSTPEDAPAGSENWFVLVNAPALGNSWDWEKQSQQYQERVLERLAGYGYDLREHVETQVCLTPPDLERMSGARHGALYGISSNNRWAAFRRPGNRCAEVRGLYFAGGTSHPGGGVPMVTLSGRVAAQMVMEDEH